MSKPTMGLAGKRIVVTGAAGGIGRAIVMELERCGARVIASDRTPELLADLCTLTGASRAIAADISDEAAVESLFDQAVGELGGVDALVNNAGMAETITSTRRQSLAAWRAIIDVNLQGTFLMARAAARRLERGGAIVNIASIAGLGAFSASNAYGVSKAGVAMLTQTLALDLARHGIRVNAVAPGVIDAPMAGIMVRGGEEALEPVRRRIPLGRLGRSEEVAYACRFLLSDHASYITGAILPVDGGWTAFGGFGDASVDAEPASYPVVREQAA